MTQPQSHQQPLQSYEFLELYPNSYPRQTTEENEQTLGALIGLGIPEYEAKRYEGKIKEGNILISVHAHDSPERDRAKAIFERAGAEDISYTEEHGVAAEARE